VSSPFDPSAVAHLNEALRLYRRVMIRVPLIVFGGFIVVAGLSYLSTRLSPPYGVVIFGESLTEWGMIALVALLMAELWWDGRRIGNILNDSVLRTMPAIGILSGLGIIAQRAKAMDMEWSGFLGPLRPVAKR
jgi:hypothetical protein